MFDDIVLTKVNDEIYIRGLNAKTFMRDLVKFYKYKQTAGEAFFRLVVTGFLIQRITISFNSYFSLEVYVMFCQLYNFTNRGFYRDIAEELVKLDNRLTRYLTEPINPPDDIMYRLNDINLQLYEYQRNFTRVIYNSKYKLGLRGNICAFGTGTGKCFAKGTKILMYDGSIKNVEDIKVNEEVMGWDNTPRKVTSLATGTEMMYKINQNKKDPYIVNESHILSLICNAPRIGYRRDGSIKAKNIAIHDNKGGTFYQGDIINISVKDYIECNNRFKHYAYGFSVPIDFPKKEVLVDPYYFGLWLGDGESTSGNVIFNLDKEVEDYLISYAKKNNMLFVKKPEKDSCFKYRLKTENIQHNFIRIEISNLTNNTKEHIPDIYKLNDKETRLKLLAGLIDTDGYYNRLNNSFEIITKYKSLADDIQFTARSLGFRCTVRDKFDKKFQKTYYRLIISGRKLNEIPTLIERKKARESLTKKNELYYGINVEPIGIGEYYGFTLDGPDRMFLLADFTVVHNTATVISSLYALNDIPCIITAPKSTLDSAWKQSILKFIPNIKEEEVQLINEYKPNIPWKFLICNYERLNQAHQYANTCYGGKVKSLVIDESQNFRYLNAGRTKELLNICDSLDIKTIIPISATPIKARVSELIPILKLLDPGFNDTVLEIFRKMYNKNEYSPLLTSVIKQRLSIYMNKQELNATNNKGFPEKEDYVLDFKLNNESPYILKNIQKEFRDYIDAEIPKYARLQKDNFNKFRELLLGINNDTNNNAKLSDQFIKDYINNVSVKLNSPASEAGKNALVVIKQLEKELKKVIDHEKSIEIINYRKLCTSWLQCLVGKAMGIYFVKRRIECITQVIEDNIQEICNIINNSDMKCIIYSLYVQPLRRLTELTKKFKLNGILVDDSGKIVDIMEKLRDDNSINYLASGQSIATGTDGLQKICDSMIILAPPFRSVDKTQLEARIFRRGANSSVVRFYNVRLKTSDKNILDNMNDAILWSKNLFEIAMNIEDSDQVEGKVQRATKEFNSYIRNVEI